MAKSNGLNIELVKSKHGDSYFVKVTGAIGKMGVEGKTATYHHGLDRLTHGLVRQILNLNRSDGSGRSVPPATLMKVEKAVLARFARLKPV
tara:strand:- start:41 stop:313 length:273 start_codon:yes stop_codon:yes gene_type:complete